MRKGPTDRSSGPFSNSALVLSKQPAESLLVALLLQGSAQDVAERCAGVGRAVLRDCFLLFGDFQSLDRYRDLARLLVEGDDPGIDLLADAAGDLKPLLAGSEITASFDGNAIIGFDGCGNYTATYATQGANIEIQMAVVSAAGVPPADCEPGGELAAQSDAYQGALTGATLFDISGAHLNMYDESGNQLLTFTAAEAQ